MSARDERWIDPLSIQELVHLLECPKTELNAIIAQYELEMECEDIAEEMAR